MLVDFKMIVVPGQQALAKLVELQQDTGVMPIILGNVDETDALFENIETSEESLDELLARAELEDAQRWLAARAEEAKAFALEFGADDTDEDDEADWGEGDFEGMPEDGSDARLSAHCNIMTGKPYEQVALALVPAGLAWQVPCHLRIGGWNECPDAPVHAALFRYWGECYGAVPVCYTGDVIEMSVSRPPQTLEDALMLAQEQYLYCPDIVDQGTETVEALARSLLRSPVWYFWWD
ncbi:DUF4253 domain-containing protein [Chitinibacter sp. GC72]|uniref:DUF4253 domain-containing protein n=1 Tax=Chitinibacter sp. GC72 TaxID=1526917 RepID=UPI0012FA18C3|nr:DUF4253 domain-containing protein [Chitinibacter sp. GC72]